MALKHNKCAMNARRNDLGRGQNPNQGHGNTLENREITTAQEERVEAEIEEENHSISLMSHVRFASRLATGLMNVGIDMKKILCPKKKPIVLESCLCCCK